MNKKEDLIVSETKANTINLYRCIHVQKNWPWQEKFDKFMIMVFGFGLPHKWEIDYLSNFMIIDLGKSKEQETSSTPLGLEHFYSGFLIYCVGILGSILVFMFKEKKAHEINITVGNIGVNKWAKNRFKNN